MGTDAKATKQINCPKCVSYALTAIIFLLTLCMVLRLLSAGETVWSLISALFGIVISALTLIIEQSPKLLQRLIHRSSISESNGDNQHHGQQWWVPAVILVITVATFFIYVAIYKGISNSFLARAQQATTSSEIAINLKQARYFCADVPQFVKEYFENVYGAPIFDANQEQVQQDPDPYVDAALDLHPEIIRDDDLKEYVDLVKGRLDKSVDQSLWGNVQSFAYILAELSRNDSVGELGLADDTQCKYFDKAVAQVAEDLANPPSDLARRYIDYIVVQLGANADCFEPNNNVLHDDLLKYAKSKAIRQAIEYPVISPVEIVATPEAPTPTPQTNLPSIVETPVPDYQYTFSKPLMAGTHYEPMTYCSTSAVYDATKPRDKTITRLAIEGETLPLDVVIGEYAVARVPGSMITTQPGAATTNDTCFVLIKAAYFEVNWNDVFSGLNGRQ